MYVFVEAVRTMQATIFAAVPSFEVVRGSKNQKSLVVKIIILLRQTVSAATLRFIILTIAQFCVEMGVYYFYMTTFLMVILLSYHT